MLSITWDIEKDSLRRIADAVHKQAGYSVEITYPTEWPGDPIKLALRAQGPRPHSCIFKGSMRECYSYLNGWLHATKKEVR